MMKNNDFDVAINEINKKNSKNINKNENNNQDFTKPTNALFLEFMYLLHQENMAILAGMTDKETLDKVKDIYNNQADKIITEYSKNNMVDELVGDK